MPQEEVLSILTNKDVIAVNQDARAQACFLSAPLSRELESSNRDWAGQNTQPVGQNTQPLGQNTQPLVLNFSSASGLVPTSVWLSLPAGCWHQPVPLLL